MPTSPPATATRAAPVQTPGDATTTTPGSASANQHHDGPALGALLAREHMSAGVVIDAAFTDPSKPGPRHGPLIVAGGVALAAVSAYICVRR